MSNLGDTGGTNQLSPGWSVLDSQDAGGGPAISSLLRHFDLPEGPAASASARHRRIALLTRTIHTEILPKLALSHCDAASVMPQPVRLIDEAELANFTRLVLDADLQACRSQMEDLVARGAGLADICLSVLTPTARMLGEMWDDDRCSFVDVTAGLGMLHTIMYRLREICAPALPVRDLSRRILFASLAGNQHTFGLRMVTEVFVDAGWDVTVETAASEAELPGIVRNEWFAIAGLSIARDEQTAHLGQTIRAMRAASFNKTIGIIVGGPVFAIQPDLARRVGADVDACDARQAVLRAEGLRLLMASLREDLPDGQPYPR